MVWILLGGLAENPQYGLRLPENAAGGIGAIYWPLVLAIYLWWSFFGFTYAEEVGIERTGAIWGVSWVIWPVAGVIFGAIAGVCRLVKNF